MLAAGSRARRVWCARWGGGGGEEVAVAHAHTCGVGTRVQGGGEHVRAARRVARRVAAGLHDVDLTAAADRTPARAGVGGGEEEGVRRFGAPAGVMQPPMNGRWSRTRTSLAMGRSCPTVEAARSLRQRAWRGTRFSNEATERSDWWQPSRSHKLTRP